MLGRARRAPRGAAKKTDAALAAGRTDDPVIAAVFIARNVNRALGTAIGPWDVGQLDEALIDVILKLLPTVRQQPLPTDPTIEQRRNAIRTAYWRRLGQPPPLYS
jgi:hypothetical protein